MTSPGTATILRADARALPLADASVDSIVCDPPYALPGGFMGKTWDRFDEPRAFQQWCETWAREAFRVLKPGGHMLAFGGTRSWHRLACAIEDAGFEIRDSIGHGHMAWTYGQGFSKGIDVSKAIDKGSRRDYVLAAMDLGLSIPGNNLHDWTKAEHSPSDAWWERFKAHLPIEDWQRIERAVVGHWEAPGRGSRSAEQRYGLTADAGDITAPATDAARRWQGWNTSLKPAWEPIVVARKPLIAPSVNVLKTIESSLRAAGVREEIRWAKRPASGAESRDRSTSLSSTDLLSTAATFADLAAANGTKKSRTPTANASAPSTPRGGERTPTSLPHPDDEQTRSSARPSSTHMGASVPAVERGSQSSSLSTTSRAAEPRTESPSTARSTRNSGDLDSRPVTEFFAGIATGLTGSRATVRIGRLADGTFVWPDGLPRSVAGGPLTVAANVLAYGTGALNIDACRLDSVSSGPGTTPRSAVGGRRNAMAGDMDRVGYDGSAGRWPTNVVLSHAPLLDEDGEVIGDACADGCVPGCPVAELDAQSGVLTSGANPTRRGFDKLRDAYGDFKGQAECVPARGAESGGASRFFPVFRYEAKAPADERPRVNGVAHPTVKPLGLIRWMCRLVTPPGGMILDPFAGSGTTLEAALLEGFHVIASETDADYLPLIQYRHERARRRLQPGVARLAKTKPTEQADGQGDLLADLFGGAA